MGVGWVVGGGWWWPVGLYIVSAQSLSPELWIWYLDLGLGFGTGLGLDNKRWDLTKLGYSYLDTPFLCDTAIFKGIPNNSRESSLIWFEGQTKGSHVNVYNDNNLIKKKETFWFWCCMRLIQITHCHGASSSHQAPDTDEATLMLRRRN